MSKKTVEEITAAHRRTIEIYTGKMCEIILADKDEYLIKGIDLTTLLLTCEKYNTSNFSINSDSVNRDTVRIRRVFCLLANKAGYSQNKIGFFLGHNSHCNARHAIQQAQRLHGSDKTFKALYEQVLRAVVQSISH